MITSRVCSRSIHSYNSIRHEKVALGMQNEPSFVDILAELKSQKVDIKEYVNNKISTLRQGSRCKYFSKFGIKEIQG